jgi:precorrin-6A synthase
MSAAMPPVALSLIGIGTGNPDHLTREAQAAMQAADLILLPHKGEDKAELAALRRDLCDAVLATPGPRIAGFDMPVRRSTGDDYLAQVDEWHAAITRCWQAAIVRAMADGMAPRTPGQPLRVALLVWGDPALYDSTLRIAARMQPAPHSVRVVAGISSMQVLCAAHAIALKACTSGGVPTWAWTARCWTAAPWPRPPRASCRPAPPRASGMGGSWIFTCCGAGGDGGAAPWGHARVNALG